MTTHLSWLSSWPPVKKFDVEDIHHTSVSEFTAGPTQVADFWERPKVAYESSYFVEVGDTEVLESLLWLKRALHGKSVPIYIWEPFARMLTDEPVGTGDGTQVAWILPILDPDGGTYSAIHIDGVVSGSKIFGAANLISAAGAMADDSTIWTASGGSVALSSDYRWWWGERCLKATATGSVVLQVDLDDGDAVGPVSVGYDYYGMAHVRADFGEDVIVGISWFNSSKVYLSTDWGSGTAISEGAWTMISSGAQTAPASAAYGSVSIKTDGSPSASEVMHVGGVGLSAYAAEWFHPDGAPCVVALATPPSADEVLTYTGRAQAMRRMRSQRDNLKHSVGPAGHARIAKMSFLEDVE